MPVDCDITILIPAKNEEHRLPPFLEQVIAYCQNRFRNAQIIVINDGSTDKTSDVVRNLASRFAGLQLLELPFNKGKGYALKRGMFAAQGKIVVFLDADGSTPVNEIGRHVHHFQNGVDIVIGSRVLKDPSAKVMTLSHRKWIGVVFNALVHFLLIKNIKDTQCGFKMFRQEIISNLFGRMYLNGYGIDLEILFVSKQLGLNIKEVAVNWNHVAGSKVNLVTDSFVMLVNILQIHFWHPVPLAYDHPHMSDREIRAMSEAEESHWWFKAKALMLRSVIKRLPTPETILDAGCGSGQNAMILKDIGYYVGTDVVKEALLICRRRQIPNVFLADIKHLALKDELFELIVCLDVMEHVDDDLATVNELKRLLKKNGRLILGVPAFRSLFSSHDVSLSHLRRYGKGDLKSLINDGGLELERLDYWYAFTFIPVYLIRKCRRFLHSKNRDKSDTSATVPYVLNKLMVALLTIENWLQQFLPMPFGTTLVAVAKIKHPVPGDLDNNI